jgi:23S rRNA (cytosine1962-C5)-methyltransferase
MKRRQACRATAPRKGAGGESDALARVAEALGRRASLLAQPATAVGRMVHSVADGIAGLVIERLGPVLVAQLHEGQLKLSESAARDLCAHVAQTLGSEAVYRKVYPKDRSAVSADLERQHRDPSPWIGAQVPPELPVLEHGMTFLVRPYDGYLTGLFLDHRLSRLRVRQLAGGRRVLNAFAYTCGFTLAAVLGGARETVSVDISKKSLTWGRRNLEANGVAPEPQRFICSDVLDYYRRAVRQGRRFDLILLDPPTFARQKGSRRTFVLERDLDRLVRGALTVLDPGGLVLLSVNLREMSFARLEHVLVAAARAERRQCELRERLPLPEDFCGDQDYAKSVLARVL